MDNLTTRRDERNNPVFNLPFDMPMTRCDNTLVIIDSQIADFEMENGGSVTIGANVGGTIEGGKITERHADLVVIYREPSGSRKAYTMPLSWLVGAVMYHHDANKYVPHLRPVTSADAEVAVEDPLPEPTEEELIAAMATTPPPIQHVHQWETDPKSNGLIDVCKTCGEMRA